MSRTIEIDDTVTVGKLAELVDVPVTTIVGELFKSGVLATVNERIDFDTASIVLEELELDVELTHRVVADKLEEKTSKKNKSTKGDSRPPVVAMMGHVDHGKTSLLDYICKASTAKGEAGGITQHISAYQVKRKDRMITFLDTPGHEAFAAIREHGAKLTDLVVIVIAADDGIKPQTLEAIRFANQAGVKMLIAINKIDKEGANAERIYQQLSDQNILVEKWGGDTVTVEVSAKTGTGIDDLLDMILLVTDVEELKAETNVPATGLIIEAHLEKGRGSVAIALVEEGYLEKGSYVVTGSVYAKIRNLENTLGGDLEKAGPSTPVLITGFKSLPEFGDTFEVVKSEKEARSKAEATASSRKDSQQSLNISSSELIRIIDRKNEANELNVIIKADVQGSLTAVIDSIKTMETEDVTVKIVGSGIGNITERDQHLAATSGAIIYGFNVDTSASIRQLANRDNVSIRTFKIIYELIDDVKQEMIKIIPPEIVKEDIGRLIVRGIFKIGKTEVICGGEVTKGKLIVDTRARLTRDDKEIADMQVTRLQQGPQEVKEVLEGNMCGVSFATESRVEVQESDKIEFYTVKVVQKQL
ncbi:MAG: translation initiation factor IF-2 [Patescibacteria group bacterium]